ncbi:glycosyltransferase family 4 protein [Methylomonas sp. LL1]|uniref:glycosyltransferase family 4 protein n=1 Tax=Methylomonas sp. LL1 TaxID=2785785 RepID=UPI0018C43AE3|nr:glycosyltransferase family 4 protein [Methylomonas sp. LL1]QPK64915.1 glycosyltransferase family 4 protein [Methylomonas sp. LL1]
MRLLFCCEFYFPSVGGVQEVMRQIAERLVLRGHEVTVATTRLADRQFSEYNGVKIVEFGVTGNLVRGMEGEIENYRNFVKNFPCDALMIKAAQQWTFDALWPVLDSINIRKVFIPCGFSGLFEPTYVGYFKDLPDILRKFDHLIFYAERYRDTDFARAHGITNLSILPNGASEIEFSVAPDPDFRLRHSIPESSFVLLTVGSMTGVKGHRELVEAFVRLKASKQHVTLILNGNPPPKPAVELGLEHESVGFGPESVEPSADYDGPQDEFRESSYITRRIKRVSGLLCRLPGVYRKEGWAGVRYRIRLITDNKKVRIRRFLGLAARTAQVFCNEGFLGVRSRLHSHLEPKLARFSQAAWFPASLRLSANPLEFWIGEAKRQGPDKMLLVTDFPRPELVQAYMAADLFVFASNIEYSPLVLYESAAAGTPFLSVPVGNAEEIAQWTGAGIICPAPKDERGYTRVKPERLAKEIAKAMSSRQQLETLGQTGRLAWEERFTWEAISRRYESILSGGQSSMENNKP